MFKINKGIYLSLILVCILSLSACSSLTSGLKDIEEELNRRSLRVEVSLEDELHYINVERYEYTVSNGDEEIFIKGDEPEIIFDKLSIGEWNIDVRGYDKGMKMIFEGRTKVLLEEDFHNSTPVNLLYKEGPLSISIFLDKQIKSEDISLLLIGSNGEEKYGETHILDLSELEDGSKVVVAEFEGVRTGSWDLIVKGLSDDIVVNDLDIGLSNGSGVNAAIKIEDSALDSWQMLTDMVKPKRPTGLRADLSEGDLLLEWNPSDLDEEIIGYALWRGKSSDGSDAKLLNSANLIEGVEYIDSKVEVDTPYYYWIRAYNDRWIPSYSSGPYKSSDLIGELVDRHIFSSSNQKELELGYLGEGSELIIAISPLKLEGSRHNFRYEVDIEFDFDGGSYNRANIVDSSDAGYSTLESKKESAQSIIDDKMRQLELELLAQDDRDNFFDIASQSMVYREGDKRDFYVITNGGYINSTLKRAGANVDIYLEDGVTNVSEEDLGYIQDRFDNHIFDGVMNYFSPQAYYGDKYDIDGTGKPTLLITEIESSGGIILGFFNPNDYSNHSTSNRSDMFYINSKALDGFGMDTVLGTVAHEFQHLIFFREKQAANRMVEDVWINEAFSILAEELTGYGSYEEDNRIYSHYFPNPNDTSLASWTSRLSDYGASGLFGLYLYDQFGPSILGEIIQSGDDAFEVISKRRDFEELFLDWAITNYITNEQIEDRYSYNGFNLAQRPSVDRITGTVSDRFDIVGTGIKYYLVEGNGSNLKLRLDIEEDMGVVIYKR